MNKELERGIRLTHATSEVRTVVRSEGDEEVKLYQFVISDESVDRHGTVVKMSGWNLDNYNANGVVLYMHDHDKLIGKGRAFIDGKQLIGEVEFLPAELSAFAEEKRKMVEAGFLKATSVGFLPSEGHWGDEKKMEDPDVFYFDKQDLLEFSIVTVPSNPNANKRSQQMDSLIRSVEKVDRSADGMSDYTRTKLDIADGRNRRLSEKTWG